MSSPKQTIHSIHCLAPQTARHDSAFVQREVIPKVVSRAEDNMAGSALANGSMSSNQSGDYPARSAMKTPKAKLQSLQRQLDFRRGMQTFIPHIAWESEVWIAETPDHMIHFNGERFLGLIRT